jgi:hypothetical protein
VVKLRNYHAEGRNRCVAKETHWLRTGMCKTDTPRVSIGVSIGAGMLMTCNWLPKLPKNLKLDF